MAAAQRTVAIIVVLSLQHFAGAIVAGSSQAAVAKVKNHRTKKGRHSFFQAKGPFTRSDIGSLTYERIKGTGLANSCPEASGSTGTLKVGSKDMKIVDLCIEPKFFQVEEETPKGGKKFVNAKLMTKFVNAKPMTRHTHILNGINGGFSAHGGSLTFTEEDGIDYAPTTVQLPGGERVPFLFTVKDLVAKISGSDLKLGTTIGGHFKVPSYRTGFVLDPKGQWMTTGSDQAVALPALQAGGDAELSNEISDKLQGEIEMTVSKVNAEKGEISGVFSSCQPSDTDMGSKAPKTVCSKGIWSAKVEAEAK